MINEIEKIYKSMSLYDSYEVLFNKVDEMYKLVLKLEEKREELQNYIDYEIEYF